MTSPPGGVRPIRAAVVRSRGGPLSLEQLELEGPRKDEVLVRVAAAGVCRTDLDLCDDWEPADGPLVLGHEAAGVVEEAGETVVGFRPGDRVVLSYASCGECEGCRGGRPFRCARFGEANFGFRRLDGSNALARSGVRGHFFGQSSFATFCVATERNLVRAPDELSLELVAPLGCGLQTGAGTVLNALAVPAGSAIAVLGAGTVGLAAVMAARLAGADPIVAVDREPRRLGLARELGATHALRGGELARRLARIGRGGFAYVVETTGAAAVHRLAARIVAPGGAGALMTGESRLAGLPESARALGIIAGDAVPQQFIPKLIDLYRRGEFPYDRLLTFYPFEEINRAVVDVRSGTTIKAVVRMPPAGGWETRQGS